MTDIFMLKSDRRFSFKYDGEDFNLQNPKTNTTVSENTCTTEYVFADGLKVTNTATFYPEFDAVEWLSWFENTGSEPTKIISEVWDSDIKLPFPKQSAHKFNAYVQDPKTATTLYYPQGPGRLYHVKEFCEAIKLLNVGDADFKLTTSGGRSSQGTGPFFNANFEGQGVAGAIGWTGQWHAAFSRGEEYLQIKSGIEKASFKLFPGEKIRTSSFVLMSYDGDFRDGQNKFKRLIKTHYSLVGKPGRDKTAPYCGGVWGGMSSEGVIKRVRFVKENRLPFEYIWMDSGWFGLYEKESPDEFTGDWFGHSGNWMANPKFHPDELCEVAKEINDAGMKFLLWIEPERAGIDSQLYKEHPEFFFDGDEYGFKLLNLGCDEALNYVTELVSNIIKKLDLGCYRQDCCFGPDYPLAFWRANEDPERIGINEIKHIMGLYKLWDTLLERFPNLMIDNCAGGGKRIDIETLRRSVPLWRTDYACSADFDPNGIQAQNLGFSTWLPYTGTSSSRVVCDPYRFRSSYTSALLSHSLWSEREGLLTEAQTEWLAKFSNEYLRVRPYLSCDSYPLTKPSANDDVWCAIQYHRPEDDTGIMLVYRRENAPYNSASFILRGLNKNHMYTLTDADTNEKITVTHKHLTTYGITIKIKQNRTAKLYYIKGE